MCSDKGREVLAPFIVKNLSVLLSEREIVHIIGNIHLDRYTRCSVFDSRVCVIYPNGRLSWGQIRK